MRIIRSLVATAAVLCFGHALPAQETPLPIQPGDSVRFQLTSDLGTSTFTGVVKVLRNPRGCLYFLIRTNEGLQMSSFGVRLPDPLRLEVLTHSGRFLTPPDTVPARVVRAHEIQCIEASSFLDPKYLGPDSAAAGPP